MNLFRSTALLLFVATSATAQKDAIDADDGYIKFLRQVHKEKSHDDHQHLLMDPANIELTYSDSFVEVTNENQFNDQISKDGLVVIEVTALTNDNDVCYHYHDIFTSFSNHYPTVSFASVNIQDSKLNFMLWEKAPTVTSLPLFLYYYNGEFKLQLSNMGYGSVGDAELTATTLSYLIHYLNYQYD